MSATSAAARRGASGQPASVGVTRLRRLRRVSLAVVLTCLALLPFAQGIVQPASLPLLGALYPKYKPAPGIVAMNNYPRTAVVGQTERFSVRLPSRPHTLLTYILQYPDGRQARAMVRSDASGYSAHTFRISGYMPRQFRAVAAIGVEDTTGAIQAFLDFAIQRPSHVGATR